MAEVQEIIDARKDVESAPLIYAHLVDAYERRFGHLSAYGEEKNLSNEFLLGKAAAIREKIEAAEDPLLTAFAFGRIGNYIDYASMRTIEEEAFWALFADASLSDAELAVWESFVQACAKATRFLLIADNCGEIVLDKLFLEQLKKRFPQLRVQVLVRGAETLNDVTMEDALDVGLDEVAELLSNGTHVPGTVYESMPDESRAALDAAEVILAKGQGNYETLSMQGRHIFFSFLCKCAIFTEHFNVPQFTGMFIEEL